MKVIIRPGNALDFEAGALEELEQGLRAALPDLEIEQLPNVQRGRGVTWPQVIHLVGDAVNMATAALLMHQAIKWARRRFGQVQPQPPAVPRSITRPI